MAEETGDKKSDKRKKWAKYTGAAVFGFFLLKGIGWLVVFALAYFGMSEISGCN